MAPGMPMKGLDYNKNEDTPQLLKSTNKKEHDASVVLAMKEMCDALSSDKPSLQMPSYLPENTEQFINELTELDLTDQNLKELPEIINIFFKLQTLKATSNLLQSLPNIFNQLLNLSMINLASNELTEVPDSISELKHLTELILSNNQLKTLPDSYSKLRQLKNLDISNNKFTCIPKCVFLGLQVLKTLNISLNPKAKLNVMPYSIYIECFSARGNQNCGVFPDWILHPKYCNLKFVYLDNTEFDFFNFTQPEAPLNLRIFSMIASNLSSNVLKRLTKNMVSLEVINVPNNNIIEGGNVFKSIPIEELQYPEHITELSFSATGVTAIPSAIKKLKNLKILDVGYNDIFWLPDEFAELKNLKILNIESNGFLQFPSNFGNLRSLQELCAQKNCITSIPQSFSNLSELRFLDLYDNELSEIPEIVFNLKNLIGLDLCQNFFDMDDLKQTKKQYSKLQENLREFDECDDRKNDHKELPANLSDDLEDEKNRFGESYFIRYDDMNNSQDDSDVEENAAPDITTENLDENWDEQESSSDEFDPTRMHSPEKVTASKRYYPEIPNNFCPKDFHARKIKAEVKQMQKYGSLPVFEIEEGQFDDA